MSSDRIRSTDEVSRRRALRSAALAFLTPLPAAFAQDHRDPFSLIRVIRRSRASTSAALVQQHRSARVPVDVLGLRSITGTQQAWLIEAHGSFASIEATDNALSSAPPAGDDSDGVMAPPTLVGILRPGLSYRADDAIRALPSARYFQLTFFRTRPGTSMDFAEVMRTRNAALDQINLERPEIGYQMISGAESGLYLFLAPLPSLQTIDNAMARTWGRGDGPVQAARQATSRASSEADIWRESLLFRVDPALSHVSDSFASAAPAFWRGR